jgi:hypothetical protein
VVAESWDWMRVLVEPCPHCGTDVSVVGPADLPDAVRAEAGRWETLLAETDDDQLRARPDDGSWTALEYGCHCRDVLSVMTERVARTLVEDDPEYGWWDHEASAVDEHYNEQDPMGVAGDLGANAEWLAGTLALVEGAEWDRRGTRRGAEPFTVAGLARFTLHELVHHREDAESRLG